MLMRGLLLKVRSDNDDLYSSTASSAMVVVSSCDSWSVCLYGFLTMNANSGGILAKSASFLMTALFPRVNFVQYGVSRTTRKGKLRNPRIWLVEISLTTMGASSWWTNQLNQSKSFSHIYRGDFSPLNRLKCVFDDEFRLGHDFISVSHKAGRIQGFSWLAS